MVQNTEGSGRCVSCDTVREGAKDEQGAPGGKEQGTLKPQPLPQAFSSTGGAIGASGFSFTGGKEKAAGVGGGAIGPSGFSFAAPSVSSSSQQSAFTGGFSFGVVPSAAASTGANNAGQPSTGGGFSFGAPGGGKDVVKEGVGEAAEALGKMSITRQAQA
jgi:hypothetical protein